MDLQNLKQKIGEVLLSLRQKITTHPKVIIWRLWLFNYSPFLGKHALKILTIGILLLFIILNFYFTKWQAPNPFPAHTLVTVERGDGLTKIANDYESKQIVRSAFWLKVFVVLLGGEKRIVAGDYYFPTSINVFGVAKMLHQGKFGLIPVRVTIHEGLSSFEIADLLVQSLPAFNKEDFLDEVDRDKLEGYLFPDTYFFMPNAKASDVILTMRETFAREFQTYEEDFLKSGKTLEEIVTMASIIEGEGNNLESKRMISGILWRRLRIDMPLQVDAPFKYYNGKNSYTLSKEDLAEDHPYNTYKNKGLPAGPINNPGIDSIRASIAPTASTYLYFMSDKSGNTYYAKDFEGHQTNRENHL